jgi:antitoxin (DNA-binding transcriptional repressor) of toxin-antitoxin stability system
MRALDEGEAFTVIRNGVPVGELVPVRPRVFIPAETVAAAFRRAADRALRFRRDVDAAPRPGPDAAWLNIAVPDSSKAQLSAISFKTRGCPC